MKKRGYERPLEGFRPIHMPKNTGAGVILAGAQRRCCGFALIWYMWWLAAVSLRRAASPSAIGHTFNYNRDFYIPADEVVRDRRRAHPTAGQTRSDDHRASHAQPATRGAPTACDFYVHGRAPSARTARCSASGST